MTRHLAETGKWNSVDVSDVTGAAALTSTAPASVTRAAAAVGVATDAARADHKHDVTTAAASAQVPGDAASEGSATSLARSDHKHSLPAYGTGAGTIAQGDDSRFTDARTPLTHATSHKSGGSDAIKLDELAAPTDVTTLNSTTSEHGLLRKLDGLTTTFLRGDGTWATPVAAASVIYTQVEKDLGARAKRSGTFDITGLAGLTADKQVSMFQAAAAYTGKGTLKDEIEMDQAHVSGRVYDATTIRVYWTCGRFGALKGNVKFNYLVSA